MSLNYTIGERIQLKRKQFGMTQTELAKKLGITHAAVHQWESDLSSPNAINLIALLKIFDCSAEWLLQGIGIDSKSYDADNIMKIPVFTDEEILNAEKVNRNKQEWVVCSGNISEHCFAYRIGNHSMLPVFLNDDIVVIDPKRQPETDGFVLVAVADTIFVRKYIVDKIDKNQTRFSLVPLNSDYSVISWNEEKIEILGTVIEHRSYRKN